MITEYGVIEGPPGCSLASRKKTFREVLFSMSVAKGLAGVLTAMNFVFYLGHREFTTVEFRCISK